MSNLRKQDVDHVLKRVLATLNSDEEDKLLEWELTPDKRLVYERDNEGKELLKVIRGRSIVLSKKVIGEFSPNVGRHLRYDTVERVAAELIRKFG